MLRFEAFAIPIPESRTRQQSQQACDEQCRGFTLIESMAALAVAAIPFTLAAPSVSWLIQSNAVPSTVSTFLADMRYARSESIRRGGGVVMCCNDAPEAANPVCGTDAGAGGTHWVSGWIIFITLIRPPMEESGCRAIRCFASRHRFRH